MSPQQQIVSESPDPVRARRVDDVPVAEEMSDSFLAYALSVITSRAIPDVRDGLKPVQRRVLWSMLQMRVRPGTPYRKSARIVGDTMGRYHPHGDAAIYDTLVRMGQDFSRMVPLVDPQGNFGSLDDPPAAARYTECRLSGAAMDMVDEVDEDTVDFRPTYDGEGTEPVVLPAALPNLLVNGTAGIAVGMATNMLPHNLAEIRDAVVLVMSSRSPRPTSTELMEVVTGPDFPGGGIVLADEGLRQAYETGRGAVRVRARLNLEQVTRRRRAIVVTELPHLVGPEKVVSRIAELTNAGRLQGVSGVADLTGMDGLRLQIDLKADADPGTVLADLYRLTSLEETFNVNNVVLVNGVPSTVGLRELCEHHISHRLEVIVRRTRHRLRRAQERLHIVEGLLIALDHIDEIVDLIRKSADASVAHSSLMAGFGLTEVQASHILDMALRRLTSLEYRKLQEEAVSLRSDIKSLEAVLASDRKQRNIVRSELNRIVDQHGRPRRAQIVDAQSADQHLNNVNSSISDSDEPAEPGDHLTVRDRPCVVTLSTSGNLGRMPPSGARKSIPGRHDLIASHVNTSTSSTVAAITNSGRVFGILGGEIPEASNRIRGAETAKTFDLSSKERVLAVVGTSEQPLVLTTAGGTVKRLATAQVLGCRPGAGVIALAPGDQVVAAFMVSDEADMVIAASDGRVLRMASSSLRLQGPGASGVLGMKLLGGAAVIGAGAAPEDAVLVQATSTGGIKSTRCAELPTHRRGGQGVLAVKLADGETVTVATVGVGAPMMALMGRDDNPARVDPVPVPLQEQPTARYRAPTRGERVVHALAPGRW